MKHQLKYLVIFALVFAATTVAQAQIEKFKAVYVYNLSTMVDWPVAEKSANFVIGVLGQSDIIPELELIAQRKKIFGQNILIEKYGSVSEIRKCHVLFASSSMTRRIPEVVVKIGDNPTLIIAEKAGAIDKGAAFNLIVEETKLRYELKKINAIRQHLKLSPDTERLASKVY